MMRVVLLIWLLTGLNDKLGLNECLFLLTHMGLNTQSYLCCQPSIRPSSSLFAYPTSFLSGKCHLVVLKPFMSWSAFSKLDEYLFTWCLRTCYAGIT
jgi:hypothetical protein